MYRPITLLSCCWVVAERLRSMHVDTGDVLMCDKMFVFKFVFIYD